MGFAPVHTGQICARGPQNKGRTSGLILLSPYVPKSRPKSVLSGDRQPRQRLAIIANLLYSAAS